MGKIIAFEGMDGCGKDTQIDLLIEYLKEKDIPYAYIPQLNTEIGKLTRSEYLSGNCGEFENRSRVNELLFTADRMQMVFGNGGVIDSQVEGKIVILNRYLLSAFVYALFNKHETKRMHKKYYDYIKELNKPIIDYAYPDLTFYLRISPEESLKRIKSRNKNIEVYEKAEMSKKIYSEFEYMVERESKHHAIQLVNGSSTIEEIRDGIRYAVDKYILQEEII